MARGKCKWWNSEKGFGFLANNDGTGDVFCHFTGIRQDGGRRDLAEGDNVEFDIIASDRGPKAENVVKV